MIHQMRQTPERRAVRESSFQGVETRNLQAADEVSIGRRAHDAIVASMRSTTPDDSAENTGTAADNSAVDLSIAIPLALARAGLSHKQACAFMGMDTGNWARALHGEGHVSLQRLLKLPVAFWCEFLPLLAEPVGLAVSHEDMADIALKQTAVAVDALCRAVIQLQRRAG